MELIKTAKRLKKEKINVDLISFGECEFNQVTDFYRYIYVNTSGWQDRVTL